MVKKVFVAKYYPGKPRPPLPEEGTLDLLIHTSPHGKGASLSPYQLRNEKGQLLENVWQFSKVYPFVRHAKIPVSRFHPNNIIWQHPEEKHVEIEGDKINILPEYWAWREKGFNNPKAVRYPNGYHGRKDCLFALWPTDKPEEISCSYEGVNYVVLNYVEARKRIYCGEYFRLLQNNREFLEIQSFPGTIRILDVDAPPGNTELTKETVVRMLNDTDFPFGHGVTIGSLLLGGVEWIV